MKRTAYLYPDRRQFEYSGVQIDVRSTVSVRPQFKVLPKDVEADESDDVTFQCEASGHPTPAITWYKNGDVIDEVKFEHISVGDDEITIMEALESDEGIYQCFARNDGGEIIASAQLNVRGKGIHAIHSATSGVRKKTTWVGRGPYGVLCIKTDRHVYFL